MNKDKLKKILSKVASFEKNANVSIAKEFTELDEKIDSIKEELKKKLESELVLEIDKEELKGDKGERGGKFIGSFETVESLPDIDGDKIKEGDFALVANSGEIWYA